MSYNGATRINPGVDPALGHLEKLPTGHPLDGDFVIREGHAFAFEPNALRDGQRVCVGGTVLLTSNGPEELNSVPNRLNVVLQASDAHNDFNLAPMYDRLVNYDANGKLVPQLATSWKFDADATHLTPRLRDGTNFHSGNPFTARDVVYTLDRAKKIGSGVAAFLTNYVSAEAVDQHHVNRSRTSPGRRPSSARPVPRGRPSRSPTSRPSTSSTWPEPSSRTP
ncbi:ABC transporter substrate-binding protein [Streptomyces sp. NPDC056656]|uniref:ABC transporter substrate-binding protein n=1 Tax=Streptomyces sp. NPDC056656 TaxID=3345895 RepID=UPI0036875A58